MDDTIERSMYEPTSARFENWEQGTRRAQGVRHMAKNVSPVLVALLVLLIFNAIIPRLTNYYYWVKPDSTMGWAEQMQGVVLHQIVPGKKNVIVIGDSRVSEGFSAVLANKMSGRSDINFIQAGIPGTTPRVWYYFLKKVDPDHRLFAAVVLMTPRFDDDNDSGDLTNNAIDLTYLTPITDFRDIPAIANSFTGLREKIHAVGTLLMPLMTAREDLFDFVQNPGARLRDAQAYHGHFSEWLLAYRAPAISVPALDANQLKTFDVATLNRPAAISAEIKTYIDSVLSNPPGVSPAHSTAYRTLWYGKIADEYAAAQAPLLVFQVPRGPYEQFSARQVRSDSGLSALAREKRVTLLDPHPFEMIERPQYFQDALHVNGSGQVMMTEALTPLVAQQISPEK